MILLTRLSLANRAIVALLSLLIVGVGLWATATMKQELLPAIEQPTAVVVVTKPGASPATLDKQVVVPLAQALEGIGGVDKVASTTSNGSAQISVTWPFGGDGGKIITDIRTATNAEVGSASSGATATVIDGSTGDIPVLALGLTSDDNVDEFAERVDTILVPAIKKVPGVRGVEVAGLTQERVLVTVDPAALVAFKVDQATIGALLRTAGTVIPAGTSVEGEQSLAIEVGQENATLADIAAMPIPALAGPVLLSQVATVALVPVDQSSISRVDGRPSVGLTITKTPDANAVQVSHAVADVVAAQVSELGTASASHTIFDQSTMVEKSIHDLSVEGGLGLIFAILIILVFLLSPRATVITAISIPLSLLIAIIALRLGGFSLNIFTLAALTVAVGRVVDDSIVVIENIVRRRGDSGLTPSGVRASVAQVAGAVTASTLTTVAVFLPVAFVGGIAGELFRPFAVTVAVALMASLVVSLTIVPVLAYWFLRTSRASAQGAAAEVENPASTPEHAERTTRLQRGYLPALGFALRRPILMVIVAVLVFGGSIVAAGSLKTDLLGGFSDARAVQVQQKMPVTATLASGDAVAAGLEKAMASVSQVESYQTTVGSQGAAVRLDLVLTEKAQPEAAMSAIRKAVAGLPRAEDITVQAQATQTTSSTIDVMVKGNNEADLATAATSISDRLGSLDQVSTVTTDLAGDQPLLKVAVNQAAAAAQGFTTAEVGTAIAAAVEGERLGTVSVDGVSHDLVLRSQQTDTTPAAIGALPLPVSAIQQQRTQKDATDAVTQEQEKAAADARDEANRQAASQVDELAASRAQSVSDLATLRAQLASLIANPPPADPAPVTAGELASVPYEQLVAQLSSAVDGAAEGIKALDKQIAAARKAISDGQAQQAETDRLTQRQRDLENVRATPLIVSDLATVEVVNAPSTITRSNGERVVTVSVTPKAGDLGGATQAIDAAVATLDLPDGVSLDQSGAADEQSASFAQLGFAMVIALALVYIVLVATFRSLLQPLLLLISVPLAATGAILGLLVTGTPLGIPALIGMLMLIGIVVTNAIVLIDLINEFRREGASIDDSVTHGARLRLRPIIMTAVATVFALLPMAMGLTGGGAFISQSLAIVVIGGLISSTVLTLLVLPAIYVLQQRGAERRQARRESRAERAATGDDTLLAGDALGVHEAAGENDHERLTT